MRTRLRQELSAALKSGDRTTVAALRSALSAIENAESAGIVPSPSTAPTDSPCVAGSAVGLGAGEVQRRVLSVDDVRAVVQAEVDERAEMAAEYARLGQPDRADRLRAEAAVLRRYLAPSELPDIVT